MGLSFSTLSAVSQMFFHPSNDASTIVSQNGKFIPQGLRRNRPKWIVIHHGELTPASMTVHEGVPVTNVEKSVLDVLNETGRLLACPAGDPRRTQGRIH